MTIKNEKRGKEYQESIAYYDTAANIKDTSQDNDLLMRLVEEVWQKHVDDCEKDGSVPSPMLERTRLDEIW